MTIRDCLIFVCVLVTAHVPIAARAAASDLASVRALYASASYEEALSQLESIDGGEDADQVDHYRALCLLALGRQAEAERSLDRIVVRSPLYVLDQNESPRLAAMFQAARKRMLSTAAKEHFAKAKMSYDSRQFAIATSQFKTLLAIANDPDAQAETLSDLRQLAEGFLTLSEAAAAAGKPAAPSAPPAAIAPAAVAASTIYSAADADVVPPIDVERPMPQWAPPAGTAVWQQVFRGTLVIVVDERGAVESAAIAESVWPLYDRTLLNAASRWRFRPATKGGQPVKYRKRIDVVLLPRS